MTDAWWQRLPQRCLEENERLRQLEADGLISGYRWELDSATSVRIVTRLLFPARAQDVEVRFPQRYPDECPSVVPRPFGTRLSSHQFLGDGVLCLELGPDNWHPVYGAADLLRSAWKLLAYEQLNRVLPEPLPIPSRHVDTLGMQARGTLSRMIVPAVVRARLAVANSSGTFAYSLGMLGRGLIFWPTQVPSGEVVPGIPPSVVGRELLEGQFFRIASDATPAPKTVDALREHVSAHGLEPSTNIPVLSLVLLVKSQQEIEARYVVGDEAFEVTLLPDRRSPIDERSPAELRSRASTARVGIVGLGSIGSKVAVSLARTGVRQFVLVDGDVLLPDNIVRHSATFLHAGLMKTDAAKVQIDSVVTEPARVQVFDHAIGDASNAEVHAKTLETLSGVDVLVDATGDAQTSNLISSFASDTQRPVVWGEVFAGGLGGVIGYAHPKLTPCPSCVRAGFLAQANAWPPAPRRRTRVPYAAEGLDEPLVAVDAEVTTIAGCVAVTALRLLGEIPLRGPAVTLLGFREGWIFARPMETRLVYVRADDFSCPRCWLAPSSPDPRLLEKVEGLFNPARRDHDSAKP